MRITNSILNYWGGGSVDLNDTAALKALYYAMMDALTFVVITEDMCVYDDTPSSENYGGYFVSLPEIPEFPEGINLTIAVSGLFKDVNGNTHRLETLKLQPDDEDPVFRGSWMESDIRYNLFLKFPSFTDTSTAFMGIITGELPAPIG